MSLLSRLRVAVAAGLLAVATFVVADTPNRDPGYNPPLGYAKVTSFLGASTYLSSRPRRVLVLDNGVHYLVGTGQTAIGVSPAQSAITVVSRNPDGTANTGFFGTGRRAFKLAPGGVTTDTLASDAVIIPKFGIAIVGRFLGAPGGYVVLLDFAGNAIGSFGTAGVRYFNDLQPATVAVDASGIYVVGTTSGGASATDIRIRAIDFSGADRTGWGATGVAVWGYVDALSRVDYDDLPASAAVDADGRLVVVGSSRRAGSVQQLGHVVVLSASGAVTGSRGDEPTPCEPGGLAEFEYTRVITAGATAYVLLRNTVDNASCPSVPRQAIGVSAISVAGLSSSLVSATSTRASCCGGDGVGLAVTDLARDARGRIYVSFSTTAPGGLSRGHLVRFDPSIVNFDPDPSFGDGGFGTYNLDTPGADATLNAIALDPAQRLIAAGAYTSDLLGNVFNVDHWSFRVREERIFADSFEP
jgi:hypothetical protein